jgi:homoaconitate hydratase
MTEAEMAEVVMENYDPTFASMARRGDILVGGENFGCGSSREQASTALKYKGIDVIIASSFSETYRRNGEYFAVCTETSMCIIRVARHALHALLCANGYGCACCGF